MPNSIQLKLTKVKSLLDIRDQEEVIIDYHNNLTYKELLSVTGWTVDDVVIISGSNIVSDLNEVILPCAEIIMVPNIHGKDAMTVMGLVVLAAASWYVGGAAAGFAAGFMSATSATAVGVVVGVSMFALGAYMMTGVMSSASNPNQGKEEESPTYTWDIPRNTMDEGRAIPVCYGEELFAPQIINYYLEVKDNSDYDQWMHILLCCGEGLTNSVPTKNEVDVNQEKLTIYAESDYEFYSSDGRNNPLDAPFVNFNQLHQMRSIRKELAGAIDAENLFSYIQFNGSFLDSGYGNLSWTLVGSTSISTSNPWSGSGCCDMLLSPSSMLGPGAWFDKLVERDPAIWDIELRVWIDTSNQTYNKVFCSWFTYSSVFIGGRDGEWYNITDRFRFFYDGTNLRFLSEQIHGLYGTYTFWNVSGSVSLGLDQWHTLRVARNGNIIYIFANGVRLAYASYVNTPPLSLSPGWPYIGSHLLGQTGVRIDEWKYSRAKLQYPIASTYTPDSSQITVTSSESFVTQGVVDAFTLFFDFPAGLYVMDNDGNLTSKSVDVEVKYRINGATVWTTANYTFTDNTRYPTKRMVEITSLARNKYEINCTRTTPEDQLTTESSRIFWDGVDEILDEFMTYPNLQCVSISLKANEFASRGMPLIQILTKRTSITVPSYDGLTTRSVDPSNNANAAFDILTNTLYGSGIDASRINETLWEEWKDWCDGLVDVYKRSTFNTIYDAQYDLDKALQIVESCGRAKIIMRGTEIACTIEKPASASYIFSAGNIVDNTEKVVYLRQAERSDGIEIRFKDKNRNWKFNTVFAPGENYDSLTRVPNVIKLNLAGIDTEQQAKREAIFRQQLSDSIKKKVSFGVGIDGIMSLSGDVITYKEGGSSLSHGGRIFQSSAGTTVYLDQVINLSSSDSYKIGFINADDTELWRDISGPFDTDTSELTISASATVGKYNVYLIVISTETESYLYRITSLSRTATSQIIMVDGLQYDDDAYYNSDYVSGTVAI